MFSHARLAINAPNADPRQAPSRAAARGFAESNAQGIGGPRGLCLRRSGVDRLAGAILETLARRFVRADERRSRCAAGADLDQGRAGTRLVSAEPQPGSAGRVANARLSAGRKFALLHAQAAGASDAEFRRGIQPLLPARLSLGGDDLFVRPAPVSSFLPQRD